MKIKRSFFAIGVAVTLCIGAGCTKTSTDSNSPYVPTTADVTANATLLDLQQGRSLYLNKCNTCHSLYSPDNFSVSQWKQILASMAPRTNMNTAEKLLVTKYVCRGNQ